MHRRLRFASLAHGELLQNLANTNSELRTRERLRYQFYTRIEAPVMNDGISGVTRGEQNFQRWPAAPRLGGELSTRHAAR